MKKYYIITGLLPLIMILGNSMVIPILPNIGNDLNITSVETGMILSSFSLTAAVIIPFVGLISDLVGAKLVVFSSLMLVMIGCSLTIFAGMFLTQPLTVIIVGRFIQGVGAGGTAPLAMIIVGDLFEGSVRSRQLGNIEVFNGIGKIISPIIGTIVATFFWYRAFTVYLFIATITFIGVTIVLKGKSKGRKTFCAIEYFRLQRRIITKSLLSKLPLMLLGGGGLFVLYGLLFFMTYAIEYKYEIAGIFKGIFLSIPFVMVAFFSFFTAKKIGDSQRFKIKGIKVGSLLILFSLLLLAVNHQMQTLVISMMIVGVGIGIILPNVNILMLANVAPNERGTVLALYSMVRFLGVAVGPIVFSLWMRDIRLMFLKGLLLYLLLSMNLIITSLRH